MKRLAAIVLMFGLMITSVSGAHAPHDICPMGGALCPNEANHTMENNYHEGPCFCMTKKWELVWIEEYVPEGYPMTGRKTKWGICTKESLTPYCVLDTKSLNMCGMALRQWAKGVFGYYDQFYKKKSKKK